MPVTVPMRSHAGVPVPCVEVRPEEQGTHVLDVPCCQCPGGLAQVTVCDGRRDWVTSLVSTGSLPVNHCSCAIIQLPKGCASLVCQKLGPCLLDLWFLSLLSSGGCVLLLIKLTQKHLKLLGCSGSRADSQIFWVMFSLGNR